MEKKNNKKVFIILGCILVIIVSIIVGMVFVKKDTNVNNNNNNVENAEQKEENTKNDYSALKEDIKKAINEKDLMKAVGYYNVLKFTIENDPNANTNEYDKITNDLQVLKDERKAELLTKVDSSYDDMTQESHYNFKGFDEYQEKYVNEAFDSGEKVIFQPATIRSESKNSTNFYMIFTLLKDNWIFFDSMIFNVDGEITNISSSNFDKTTQTIGGGMVGEVAGMYLQKYPMFNALIEKIINSNETKIRLVGKDARGNVDFVLTDTDKENLKTLYELSLCL